MSNWETLRTQAIDGFHGEAPGRQLEQDIIDAYQTHPTVVERSVEKVVAQYAAGDIRSGWGVLRADVLKAITPIANPQGKPAHDREKAVSRAEQWLRTAGLHYDRDSEIVDELFGDRGMLRQHRTPDLEARITALWQELRPLGETVEAEAIERGLRHQAQRATIDNMPTKPLDETELRALARAKAADTTRLT